MLIVPAREEAVLTGAYLCSNVMHQDGKSVLRLLSDRKPHPDAAPATPNMEDMYLKYLGKQEI